MNKSKILFLIFFIVLSCVSFMIYFTIFDQWILWSTSISMNTAVVLFVVAVIPLMVYIAERLVKFSVSKGLEKNKNFNIFIAVVVIVPITLLTFFVVNDYREKGLTDVIRVNASHVTTLELDGGSTDGWRTDEKEKVEQLIEFLDQYQVKKMRDAEWNSNVSKEKGFTLTINVKNKPLIASIYENRISFLNNGNYYNVLNGPIDMDWVQEFASTK